MSRSLYQEIEQNFTVVPDMWQNAVTDGTIQRLAELMNASPMGLLGVSICNDAEQWKYFIAVSSTRATGYEYADAPDIEVYLNPDPQNAQYEVWIPVVKRQE